MNEIHTVGHGNRELRALLALLKRYDIEVVGDVRSTPYSARHAEFNREPLQKALQNASIRYLYLGAQLGARPADPLLYVGGRASYEAMAGSPAFREGIERIRAGMESYRIVLMCAEKDPFDCHRAILIGKTLAHEGVSVQHILADGDLESQEHVERRLLKKYKFIQRSFFEPPSESAILVEAYRRRGAELAYDAEAVNRAPAPS
jgi:uncharacterized protein (DUF488 family)